ncbi:unnamed protein product [Ixodes persulcatus]
MAPSTDVCDCCSMPFFGKQKYARCTDCSKRAHVKCLSADRDGTHHLASGVSDFRCKSCISPHADGRPNEDLDESAEGHVSPHAGGRPNGEFAGSAEAELAAAGPLLATEGDDLDVLPDGDAAGRPRPPDGAGAELAAAGPLLATEGDDLSPFSGDLLDDRLPADTDPTSRLLHRLLTSALDGISFLTDQVAALREENRRLQSECTKRFDLHSISLSAIRGDVGQIRDVLRVPRFRHSAAPSASSPSGTPSSRKRGGAEKKPALPATGVNARRSSRPLASIPPASPPCLTPVPDPVPDTPVASTMCPITPATPGVIVPGSSDFAARAPCADLRREASFGGTPSLGAPENASFSSVLSPQSKGKEIFVTRLNPRTTSADMVRHLKSVGVTPLQCLRLKTRHASYASFYIAVDTPSFHALADPYLWPSACYFQTFRGNFRDEMIHPSDIA